MARSGSLGLRRGWLAAGALSALLLVSGAAASEPRGCPSAPVAVTGGNDEDFRLICSGAASAFDFLVRQGFTIDLRVDIRVSESAFQYHGQNAFGMFDHGSLVVGMASFAASLGIAKDKPVFGEPLDEALFRSLVAHEVAHGIADANFLIDRPTISAHEYIAYVTQLSALEPDRRRRILERSGLGGFASADGIKDTYYLMAPEGFGVNAYLHYERPENGAPFLRRILTGGLARSNLMYY